MMREVREYGMVDWKDGNAVWLIPGEQARQPYPFPTKDECPHCGNTSGNVFRPTCFHCRRCGTFLERPFDVMPMTDELRNNPETTPSTCRRCGAPVEAKTRGNHTQGKYCDTCKRVVRLAQQKESYHRRKATKSTKKENTVRRVETGAPRGLPGNEGSREFNQLPIRRDEI